MRNTVARPAPTEHWDIVVCCDRPHVGMLDAAFLKSDDRDTAAGGTEADQKIRHLVP